MAVPAHLGPYYDATFSICVQQLKQIENLSQPHQVMAASCANSNFNNVHMQKVLYYALAYLNDFIIKGQNVSNSMQQAGQFAVAMYFNELIQTTPQFRSYCTNDMINNACNAGEMNKVAGWTNFINNLFSQQNQTAMISNTASNNTMGYLGSQQPASPMSSIMNSNNMFNGSGQSIANSGYAIPTSASSAKDYSYGENTITTVEPKQNAQQSAQAQQTPVVQRKEIELMYEGPEMNRDIHRLILKPDAEIHVPVRSNAIMKGIDLLSVLSTTAEDVLADQNVSYSPTIVHASSISAGAALIAKSAVSKGSMVHRSIGYIYDTLTVKESIINTIKRYTNVSTLDDLVSVHNAVINHIVNLANTNTAEVRVTCYELLNFVMLMDKKLSLITENIVSMYNDLMTNSSTPLYVFEGFSFSKHFDDLLKDMEKELASKQGLYSEITTKLESELCFSVNLCSDNTSFLPEEARPNYYTHNWYSPVLYTYINASMLELGYVCPNGWANVPMNKMTELYRLLKSGSMHASEQIIPPSYHYLVTSDMSILQVAKRKDGYIIRDIT